MILTLLEITLDFPYVESLKGRRALLNSFKDRVKKANLSLLDLSGEYAKEGFVAIAYLSINSQEARKKREFIEDILESFAGEVEYEIVVDEF